MKERREMSILKSKRASEGNFSGSVTVKFRPEDHAALYKEATTKNVSTAQLVRNIVMNRISINKRRIWKSDQYIKRETYTVLFFRNNIDDKEICVNLYGDYQDESFINDYDHKFSNFITNHLEFSDQRFICCEFFKDDDGEMRLRLSDWYRT